MKLFLGVLVVSLVGGGVSYAQASAPGGPGGNAAAIAEASANEPQAPDPESENNEVVAVEPADVCTFPKDAFFKHTFEELVDLEYPGLGFDGDETIYCDTDDEDYDPSLLAAFKAADTNEDGDLELVEFDNWNENNAHKPSS